jgi:hypothetical protein
MRKNPMADTNAGARIMAETNAEIGARIAAANEEAAQEKADNDLIATAGRGLLRWAIAFAAGSGRVVITVTPTGFSVGLESPEQQ